MDGAALMCCRSVGNLAEQMFKILLLRQNLLKFKLQINTIQK